MTLEVTFAHVAVSRQLHWYSMAYCLPCCYGGGVGLLHPLHVLRFSMYNMCEVWRCAFNTFQGHNAGRGAS